MNNLCIFAAYMSDLDRLSGLRPSADWVKRILQLFLFVGVGIFFIWLSLRHLSREDFRTVVEVAASVNTWRGWLILGIAAFFALLADFCRAVRGKLLLQPLQYEVRLSMMFYSVMVCFMANLALPRLGEVLRCTFLQRYEKVPFQESLGTVITERAVDMICWLMMFAIAVAINTALLNNLMVDPQAGLTMREWLETKGLSLLGNHLLLSLLLLVAVLCLLIFLTRKWWRKHPFFAKIGHFVAGMWQGFISIKDLKSPWRYWLWTLIMWVAYFLGTYSFFYALPCLWGVPLAAGYSTLVFGTVAFMIAQGGIGAYPIIVAGVLMLYGLPYIDGLAAGWVGWILQTVVALVGGFISLVLASLSKKHDARLLVE